MSKCTRNRKNSVEYYMQQYQLMNFLKDNMFFNQMKPITHDDNEFNLAFQDSFRNDNNDLDLVIDFVLEGGTTTTQSKRKLSDVEAIDIIEKYLDCNNKV